MTEEELRQQITDEEHLKLLSLGYKVTAGLTAFVSLFGLVYVFIAAMIIFLPIEPDGVSSGEPPPAFFGLFFGVIGLAFIVIGLTVAILRWQAGRYLMQRKGLTFIQVVAALSCLDIPYGTVLGVLTFVVAGRPSVKRMFEEQSSEAIKG